MTINNYYGNDFKQVDSTKSDLTSSPYQKYFSIYGYLRSKGNEKGPYLVAAYTNDYGNQELVDQCHINSLGFYSLTLYQGTFFLYVFRDVNRDGVFTQKECVGKYEGSSKSITFASSDTLVSSIRKYDIEISEKPEEIGLSMKIAYKSKPELTKSAVFPEGALRDIDDEIFNEQYGHIGLYDPQEFLEHSDRYFYALQEYSPFKTPVLFVHGRGKTPYQFKSVIDSLNQNKYQPWLFYYPSGASANELVNVLHEILFSGELIKLRWRKIIVIAEGVGALITKGAINRNYANGKRNRISAFISISAPFGGDYLFPEDGEVINLRDSDLNDFNPGSRFIKNLNSFDLPDKIEHYLFFTYRDKEIDSIIVKTIEYPKLESQLYQKVQFSTPYIYGYNESSESILKNDDVIMRIKNTVEKY